LSLAVWRAVHAFGHRWVSLGLTVVCGYVLWAFFTLPAFQISVIEIDRITPHTVAGDESLVKIQSFAGLVGYNIFQIDPNAISKEIATLPVVADARLHLILPNRAFVEIAERQPRARWVAAGHIFLVSSEGYVLGSGEAPELAVTIVDTTDASLHLGDQVDGSAVQMALQLHELLSQIGIRPQVYRYSSQEGLSVVSEEGWVAIYGTAERLVEKTQAVLAVRELAVSQKIILGSIDLRPQGRATFRPLF
jgi:cell division septal protein FtsQ